MSIKIAVSVFLLLLFSPVGAQENCTVPLPPVLNSVSVRPETGMVDISWTSSPSGNIAAYIVYIYSEEDAGWMPVDTLWNANATNYTFNTTATKYMSIRFVVASYRLPLVAGKPGCPSELSNSLGTIFCSAAIDTCKAIITLKWNKYNGGPKNVTGYEILVSEDEGPLAVKYRASMESDNFTVSDFRTDALYSFAVKALLDDGTTSSSNRSPVNTTMQRPPAWLSIDYISVNDDNKIELSFIVDPESEISRFVVERSSESIATLNISSGNALFTDGNADINIVNYYSLSAVNSCGITLKKTDVYSNILLSLDETENAYLLSWNPVRKDVPGSHAYEVFMDTGNGLISVSGPDTAKEYSVEKKAIMYSITGPEVCFIVKAREINYTYGTGGESISSRSCSSTEEIITVPNLFTPNNDLRNDRFRPVLSFTPAEYSLIISDRQGRMLFRSQDFMEEWDGSGSDQGVYLWSIRAKTPSGRVIRKSGTVTIVR